MYLLEYVDKFKLKNGLTVTSLAINLQKNSNIISSQRWEMFFKFFLIYQLFGGDQTYRIRIKFDHKKFN